MDHTRTVPAGGEDNVGIPDDLRCKRSDGKQWRCTAMSMPDKTVCEKHYIQAKKRAANSAMRASMKKAKRKSLGESEIYLESKSEDMELPLSSQFEDFTEFSGKEKKDKVTKGEIFYSPETLPVRSMSGRSSPRSIDDDDDDDDDDDKDGSENEDSRSYRTPPASAVDSDRSRSQKTFDISPMTETSYGSSESSDDTGGQPCHQCRSSSQGRVIWCIKCDKRGYCENCISTWYSDIPLEEIERTCPACRGTCSCRVCMRGDNLIKARIREISANEKLQYLYCLLSAVLPIVKQIHIEQCHEVELEKRLRGNEILDLSRTKLNADEQMCCDFCRIPIIDYHRHCTNCSYDLCLSCCKDIRNASKLPVKDKSGDNNKVMMLTHLRFPDVHLKSFDNFTGWQSNRDKSIPCPPKAYGGCGSSFLTLKRIFKMNWVAKLVKNVDEMVNACKMGKSVEPEESGINLRVCRAANRVCEDDNFLYHLSSEALKKEGMKDFRMCWSRGEPVIVKEVIDSSEATLWDPMTLWSDIKQTADEKMKDRSRTVKAVDCSSLIEIDIGLEDFMKGYFEGRVNGNGEQEMLKLKDWPTPSATEEFLLYCRPDFISKLPLLEFIHSKWGLLNVAAKLPHYSLQNDVGPKIYISYGNDKETDESHSSDNLHLNMRDMVFLLLHVHRSKPNVLQSTTMEMQNISENSEAKEPYSGPEALLNSDKSQSVSPDGGSEANTHAYEDSNENCQVIVENSSMEDKPENMSIEESLKNSQAGARWDIFRREDVPKLMNYISMHKEEFRMSDRILDGSVSRLLFDGVVYMSGHHKHMLKEKFGVEPWSFEQHIGDAVFIPAGCPFQLRHLQSSVQLGLDFLSPESIAEARHLFEEIRGLPNDHEAKLHILEVGKICLYAASSSIKEVQKLVLDPKVGTEVAFEDPNLTGLVSHNLEKVVKRRQISCI